jgi:hypothetical protein
VRALRLRSERAPSDGSVTRNEVEALRCDRCERAFREGDVVHRARLGHGLTQRCRRCVRKLTWHGWRTAEACEGGCGLLVASESWGQQVRACSDRCRYRARDARRRKSTTVECARCGEPFEQTRSDARYCSNACRQATHRARQRA